LQEYLPVKINNQWKRMWFNVANVFFGAVYDKYGESGIPSCRTINKGHRSHFYPMETMPN
jgi:hypothetical protein